MQSNPWKSTFGILLILLMLGSASAGLIVGLDAQETLEQEQHNKPLQVQIKVTVFQMKPQRFTRSNQHQRLKKQLPSKNSQSRLIR